MSDPQDHAVDIPYEIHLAHGLTCVAMLLGIITALVGAGHLVAWLTGHLSQRGLSTITMKTNAALCLMLVGMALMLLVPAGAGWARLWSARICAGLALLVGLLTVVENVSGRNLGINQLLATEMPGAMGVVSPNQMGMPSSVSFTLLGLALLLLGRRDRRAVLPMQVLALVVCLIALLSTIGFLYGAEEFYGIARYTAIAWPTAVALLLLGLGLLCARPAEGLMAQMTARDPGGVSLRRLLPAFVILSLVLGWLRLAGERAGIFDAATGTGIMMLVLIILFSGLMYHAARRASGAAAALQRSEEKFAKAFRSSPIAIAITRLRDGRVMEVNEAILTLLHFTRDEVIGRTTAELGIWVDLNERAEYIQRLATEGSVRGLEYRLRAREGENVTVQLSAEVLEIGGEPCMLATLVDTTERKRAEEALRESEEKFRQLAETSPAAIFIHQDGKFVYTNPAVESITGYSRDEFARMSPLEVVHPDHLEMVKNQMLLRMQGVTRQSRYEAKILTKDGRERWMDNSSTLILYHNEPANLVVAFDITERKHAEEGLRESQLHLARAQQIARMGSWSWDIVEDHLYCSDEAYRLFGLQPGEVSLRKADFLDFVHPEDRPQVEKALQEALVCGRYDVEYRIILKDGEERYIHSQGQTTFDQGGHPVKMEGTVQDLTERRRAEEALRQSEEKHKRLIETTNTGYVIIDNQGRVMDANQEYARLTGRGRAEDVVGHSVLEWTSPGDVERNAAKVRECIERGFVRNLEVDYLTPTGQLVPVEINATVLRAGGSIQILTLTRDITERRRAEEALRELNATLESRVIQRTAELQHRARQLQKLTLELSQVEERERRRIAVILHEDVQQQVAAAKFQLGLLRNWASQDAGREVIERVEEMLKEAIAKSRRLAHDLSPAALCMNDLGEVLRWLADRMQAQYGLVVAVDVPGETTLDSEALTMFLFRAAQEMLFNVVKHARVNEAALRVFRRGRRVYVGVSDRGRGFDPQGLSGTTGFGLLGIRERVELLGGRMKIKSAKGQGSTLCLVVPDSLKPEDRGQIKEDGDVLSAAGPASSEAPLRVLLADDHRVVREGLVSLLQEAPDLEVVGEASNGREAIDLAGTLEPDVLIVDVSLPVISGAEAARWIKQHRPATRIVALSMHEDADAIERMYQAGADRSVLKTAPAQELLDAIRGEEKVAGS